MTSYKIHTLAVRVAKLVSRLLSTNLVCDILLHKQMSDQVFPCTSLYLSNHKHLSRLSHHCHIQACSYKFLPCMQEDILFIKENNIASSCCCCFPQTPLFPTCPSRKFFTGITESRKFFSHCRQCSTDHNESFGFHLKLLVSL